MAVSPIIREMKHFSFFTIFCTLSPFRVAFLRVLRMVPNVTEPYPITKSIHVGCEEEQIMHTRHTEPVQRKVLFLSVLIYTTAHCWVALHWNKRILAVRPCVWKQVSERMKWTATKICFSFTKHFCSWWSFGKSLQISTCAAHFYFQNETQ